MDLWKTQWELGLDDVKHGPRKAREMFIEIAWLWQVKLNATTLVTFGHSIPFLSYLGFPINISSGLSVFLFSDEKIGKLYEIWNE